VMSQTGELEFAISVDSIREVNATRPSIARSVAAEL
jgi:hypothetical protein